MSTLHIIKFCLSLRCHDLQDMMCWLEHTEKVQESKQWWCRKTKQRTQEEKIPWGIYLRFAILQFLLAYEHTATHFKLSFHKEHRRLT